jgi:hypothetical protein
MSAFASEGTQASIFFNGDSVARIAKCRFGNLRGVSFIVSSSVQGCMIEECLFDRPREECFGGQQLMVFGSGNEFDVDVSVQRPIVPDCVREVGLLTNVSDDVEVQATKRSAAVGKGILDVKLAREGVLVVTLIVTVLYFGILRLKSPRLPHALGQVRVRDTDPRHIAELGEFF